MGTQIEAMGNLRMLHLTNCVVEHNSLQLLKNLRWLRMEWCGESSRKVINDERIFEKLLVLQMHECEMPRLVKQFMTTARNNHEEVKKLKVLEIIDCTYVVWTCHDFSLMPS